MTVINLNSHHWENHRAQLCLRGWKDTKWTVELVYPLASSMFSLSIFESHLQDSSWNMPLSSFGSAELWRLDWVATFGEASSACVSSLTATKSCHSAFGLAGDVSGGAGTGVLVDVDWPLRGPWQRGQDSCTYNHFFRQPAWKKWPQGVMTADFMSYTQKKNKKEGGCLGEFHKNRKLPRQNVLWKCYFVIVELTALYRASVNYDSVLNIHTTIYL